MYVLWILLAKMIPAEAEWWPLGHHEAELSLNEVTFKSNLNIAEGVYSIP